MSNEEIISSLAKTRVLNTAHEEASKLAKLLNGRLVQIQQRRMSPKLEKKQNKQMEVPSHMLSLFLDFP